MVEVINAPLNQDLAPFTQQLWKMRITHRVVFEDCQKLIVEQEQDVEVVRELYQYWQLHQSFPEALQEEWMQVNQQRRSFSSQPINFKKIPLVLSLLLLSTGLSVMTNFGSDYRLLAWFTITDFQITANQVNYYSLGHNFESFELWRFISPIFVHFNLPHILFNGLWIWVVGKAIEQRQGSLILLFIALLSAIASNLAQYYQTGPVFGGLSGVVYAVLAYAWLWDKLEEQKLAVVSNALMMFMIAWLVLGYSGILTSLGLGAIANTAHLVGLLSGLLAVASVRVIRSLR